MYAVHRIINIIAQQIFVFKLRATWTIMCRFFTRARARVIAVVVCLSVSLSVCHKSVFY